MADGDIHCPYDPEIYKGYPMGMHHCPDCGCMVVDGLAHHHDEFCWLLDEDDRDN